MGSKPLDGSASLFTTPKDVVREALSFGVEGYAENTMAESELLTAVETVFCEKRFVSNT